MKDQFESIQGLVDVARQAVPDLRALAVNPEYCLDAPMILPRGSTLCVVAGPTHKSPTYSVARFRRRYGVQATTISRP